MKTGSPGQYEGYTVDVLDALAEANNFTYSITPEQDGVYGVKDDKGNWNGMMGQLVSKVRTVSVYNSFLFSVRKYVLKNVVTCTN